GGREPATHGRGPHRLPGRGDAAAQCSLAIAYATPANPPPNTPSSVPGSAAAPRALRKSKTPWSQNRMVSRAMASGSRKTTPRVMLAAIETLLPDSSAMAGHTVVDV